MKALLSAILFIFMVGCGGDNPGKTKIVLVDDSPRPTSEWVKK